MSRAGLGHAPPSAQSPRGSSWPLALGLALLLPFMEWAGLQLLHLSGMPLTTSSLWATTLIVNALFVGLLLALAGRSIQFRWAVPGIKDIGLTLAAFVAGWVVIPMVQLVTAMFVTAGASSGGTGVSLVPTTATDMILLAAASVAAALSQEVTYRGVLWERMASSTGNRWVALVGTSLFFGLVYLSSGVDDYLSVGVAWGLVAGGLYLVTRRLSTVVVLNTLNTFLTYAVLFRYLM